MSEKPRTEPQDTTDGEESVVRYLEDHPDFLARHEALLETLEIPHRHGGQAVSLIERQVAVLRDKNQALREQFDELVRIGRENDLSSSRLHRFVLHLLAARDAAGVVGAMRGLVGEFKLDALRLVCGGGLDGMDDLLLLRDGRLTQHLVEWLGRARVMCEQRPDPDLLQAVFAPAVGLRSAAFVALGSGTPWGVLALGARRAERFHSRAGTLYLERLGEMLDTAVQRLSP